MVFRRETYHEYLAVAFIPEINYSFEKTALMEEEPQKNLLLIIIVIIKIKIAVLAKSTCIIIMFLCILIALNN